MTRNNFAIKNGFTSYEEMLTKSITIIYDHGISHFVTLLGNGWLAWIDEQPEKIIGVFKTLEQAHERLFYIFAEKELEQVKEKDVKHLC